jgi:hypothetical protein
MLPADRVRFARDGRSRVITKFFNPVTISEEVAEILGWSF